MRRRHVTLWKPHLCALQLVSANSPLCSQSHRNLSHSFHTLGWFVYLTMLVSIHPPLFAPPVPPCLLPPALPMPVHCPFQIAFQTLPIILEPYQYLSPACLQWTLNAPSQCWCHLHIDRGPAHTKHTEVIILQSDVCTKPLALCTCIVSPP